MERFVTPVNRFAKRNISKPFLLRPSIKRESIEPVSFSDNLNKITRAKLKATIKIT